MPVEREVEVETRLLPVGDHVQARGSLVMNGGQDSVVLQFSAVSLAELLQMRTGQLQPARKGITADDGGPKGVLVHYFRETVARVWFPDCRASRAGESAHRKRPRTARWRLWPR